MQLAFIPSPSQGVWHFGPFPLRAYAMMIIIGVIVAVWLGERRWTAKGGKPGIVIDVAVWAVPFGLVGGRLYHVITDHQMYFGEGKDPLDALKVWQGGLGIWGAVAMGALGAWIGCRSRGVRLAPFADAIAPGIALAQGIGRWGNWWNQELYGKPSTLPWAVEIDPAHRPDGGLGEYADIATYHPTFLYESLWCIGLAIVVIWAGKRFNLNHGRTFALYVAGYTVGRGWIEALRIDEAHHILGLRLNDWTSIVVFLGAAAYLFAKRNSGSVPDPLYFGEAAEEEKAAGEEAAEEKTAEVKEPADVAVASSAVADEEPAPAPEPDEEPAAEPEPVAETDGEAAEEPVAETAPVPEPAAEPDAETEAEDAEEESEPVLAETAEAQAPEAQAPEAEAPEEELADAEEAGDAEPAPVEYPAEPAEDAEPEGAVEGGDFWWEKDEAKGKG
ncbi:hypothetical protein GCM10027589_28060 [Actinocorallia lasiicapitis]